MKRLYIFLILVLCSIPTLMGQEKMSFYIQGQAFDRVTRLPIDSLQAELLTTDSVAIDTFDTRNATGWWSGLKGLWLFNLRDHGRNHDYLVRVTAEGYYPAMLRVKQEDIEGSRSNYSMRCDNITLLRRPKASNLREATVTATKVLFYHKGDTLVYNADALNVSEGSMLDAIIRQLPGAELKADGQILVNGRKIDALLLNGKDFFKGDPSKMLENLPAYMVKHIQVYDKNSDRNELVGREVDEKSHVMDVKLRREYNDGYMLNVEAAGGTEERYLGRLFALRFTPRTRLAVIGNVNNVNDSRRPGENTEWRPTSMPSGSNVTQMGGIDFDFDDSYTKTKANTSLSVRHGKSTMISEQSSENYLNGETTFGRSYNRNVSRNTSVSLYQSFSRNFNKRLSLQLSLNTDYTRNDSWGTSSSASFSANPSDYVAGSASLLDTLRGPEGSALLKRLAINRTLSDAKNNGESTSGNIWVNIFDKEGWEIRTAGNWSVASSEAFEHYRLDYPSGTTAPTVQNRYSHTKPDTKYGYSVSIDKWFFDVKLKGFNIVPSYKIRQSFSKMSYERHLLERLAGWNDFGAHPIGMLPSEEEWMRSLTLDNDNSYDQRVRPLWQEVCLALDYKRRTDKDDFGISFRMPLVINTQWVDYHRGSYDRTTKRTDLSPEPKLWGRYIWKDFQHNIRWDLSLTTILPDMLTQLISLPSTSDPLNVTTGNEDLKVGQRYNGSFSAFFSNSKRQSYFSIDLSASYRVNEVARGSVYDSRTGVRHYKPYNVSGGNETNIYINSGIPLDKNNRLRMYTLTSLMRLHSVDLMSTVRTEVGEADYYERPERSTVDTWWATHRLWFSYTYKKVTVGINGYGGYNANRSKRAGFTAQNVWEYQYGATLQAPLFWKLSLSTDLKVYGHRGFADPAGNRDDLVWNARLACTLTKPSLSVYVEGFDLLHKLSNRTFTMNSQGRYESYRNSLPSYLMLHVVWRFSSKKTVGQ